MILLKCAKVDPGLRKDEATVTVKELDGTAQFLPVDRGALTKKGSTSYLTVALLRVEPTQKAALVALPVESDSGAHRIWVNQSDIVESSVSKELSA